MDLDVDWSAPSFRITPGRDPLGMQTITTDRIMPTLTPGILALSERARYFSFHLFLLDDYERRRLPASHAQMSDFFRRREYELALATSLCRYDCGKKPSIGVVGRLAIGNPGRIGDAFTRDFSVKSSLGGYGLYYRSPLISMGLTVPAGTLLGDEATPVDVVDRNLGREIAETFRIRIQETAYFREFIHSARPIPEEVLVEYAEQACLCRVQDAQSEQALLRRAFFDDQGGIPTWASRQRRRAFALFLLLLSRAALVAEDPSSSAFRAAIWNSFTELVPGDLDSPLSEALGEWAALVAREALQEAVSSIWTEFCELGLTRQDISGMTGDQVDALIDAAIAATPLTFPDGSTFDPDPAGSLEALTAAARDALSELHVEEIRNWIKDRDSIAAGVAALVVISRRLPEVAGTPSGWRRIGAFDGANQPGLLHMVNRLAALEAETPTLGEFARKTVRTFILHPHERIASAKLPEFTFRFRVAGGRLRFFEETMRGHFGPSDIRHATLRSLSQDLGLWSSVDDTPEISSAGHALVQEAFG